MVSIAVVEDDDAYAEIITGYLKTYETQNNETFVISRYHDGYEIVEKYSPGTDIILMDIEMSLINGMKAAEMIREKDEQVIIIFITNLPGYALRGYKVNALDYIVKPVEYISFAQTLRKALRISEDIRDKYIIINLRDGIRKIRTSNIIRIESRGHRLTFYTENEILETTVYSMKEMEEKLEPEGFKRCSSGILVNLKRVTGIQGGYVEVDGKALPVSRRRRNEFMDAVVRYTMP